MTNQEMRQEFLILYDKITNFDAPGYEDIEISIFLTKAQERVVYSFYSKDNKFREGFEETEARRKDLKELVTGVTLNTPSTSQQGVFPNGVFFDLPEDCLYVLSEEITTSSEESCADNLRVRVKPILHDEYSINIKNPFKKPSKDTYIWRLDYKDKRHELITDGSFSVSEYHLRYLQRPQPIIIGNNTVDGVAGPLDCLLDTSVHKRIVDEAVKIATGITDPEYYQIKTIEQQQGE